MNDFDIVKKNLDYILKHGDLYDAISQKEGVHIWRKSFLKFNILLFSRVLFGLVLIGEKIKNHFAPVEKIKEAQNQIRQILGFNADIICTKKFYDIDVDEGFKDYIFAKKPCLSILYQDSNISIENYIDNLKKLWRFCNLHHINKIFLRKSDIINLFSDIDLDNYATQWLSSLMYSDSQKGLDEILLFLSPSELLNLINELNNSKFDKKYIIELGNKIDDLSVRKSLQEFIINNDIQKLKKAILQRLILILNSESAYKDKVEGKVFNTIIIQDKFVKVITNNKKGETINNTIMTIYDYLGLLDYQSLLNEIKKNPDNKEVLLMLALYLYLCGNKKSKMSSLEQNNSFYDDIYMQFKAKQKKKTKKIHGLRSKFYKRIVNIYTMIPSFFLTGILFIILYFSGETIDFARFFLFRDQDSSITKNIINTLVLPYRYSYEFEEQLLFDTEDAIKDASVNFTGKLSSLAVDYFNKKDNIIGTITPINPDYQLPKYYASGYGTSATYNKGNIEYTITESPVDYFRMRDVEPLFEVTFNVSRKDLKNAIDEDKINLFQILYPLGDDFVLTHISITDSKDDTKRYSVFCEKAISWGNTITSTEKAILISMESPEITYTYGICPSLKNSFVTAIEKEEPYTSLSKEEVNEAITKGLNLGPNATIEEIFTAIQNKLYSKTPFKDAGLSDKVKRMDEKEYIETVASLDSLVCNLATTLAVEADEELIYVSGYYNNDDNTLTTGEGHAWAMRENGDIIDITPNTILEKEENDDNEEEKSDNELEEAIKPIIAWGIQNNIPIYIILVLIARKIKKAYGRKIIFSLKVVKIRKLLNADNIEESFAKIDETLYGGINLPIKQTLSDYVEKISKEFISLSPEELKELKEQLRASKMERTLKNNALKIVNEIPFIRTNEGELQRVLAKKKNNKKR